MTFGFGLGTSWESRLIQESILRNTASYNKHRKTAEEWNIPDAEGYANSRTIK